VVKAVPPHRDRCAFFGDEFSDSCIDICEFGSGLGLLGSRRLVRDHSHRDRMLVQSAHEFNDALNEHYIIGSVWRFVATGTRVYHWLVNDAVAI
jgi:phospholipid N-methyltransferase